MPVGIHVGVESHGYGDFLKGRQVEDSDMLKRAVRSAAELALRTARFGTPVRSGRAKRGWAMDSVGGGSAFLITNSDTNYKQGAAKLNWLEGRFRMARRAEKAADELLASMGYGETAHYDLTPLW